MIDNSVSSLAEEIPAISTHENDVRHMSKDFQPSDVSGRLHVVAKKGTSQKKKTICSELNSYRTAEATPKLTTPLVF